VSDLPDLANVESVGCVNGAIDPVTRHLPDLPRSGFVPDGSPCFEAWNGVRFAHGYERFELRLPARGRAMTRLPLAAVGVKAPEMMSGR
jgi:hypothetical protein